MDLKHSLCPALGDSIARGKGQLRELNPGPLAPEARIMPLDQAANLHLAVCCMSPNLTHGDIHRACGFQAKKYSCKPGMHGQHSSIAPTSLPANLNSHTRAEPLAPYTPTATTNTPAHTPLSGTARSHCVRHSTHATRRNIDLRPST